MFFKNKYEKDLDALMAKVRMNMSNNYKDAAQADFADYCKALEAYTKDGRLSEKSRANYEAVRDTYKEKLQGYTHKDQKPYWQ